ncbi:hypothetical protein BH20ACT17_BH20ACT17_09530 [soil metagenome]
MARVRVRVGILQGVRGRPRVVAALGALIAAAIVAAIALPRGSDPDAAQSERAAAPAAAAAAAQEPTARRRRSQVVEPVAGEGGDVAALPTEEGASAGDSAPTEAASSGGKSEKVPKFDSGPTEDAGISGAEVLKNGIALPPIEAPEEVRNIVRAGNQIARTPYLWGGGHGKWLDKGYDCSGSVSYALASGGFLNAPLASGPLMKWGKPGKGKWVTIYSNPGHVFLVVAGVRFDTSGTKKDGSRWQADMRPTSGYAVRHPPGF